MYDIVIWMRNGEGISKSGWNDEKLDCDEEGPKWLDHKYVCSIVFLVDVETWKDQFTEKTLLNF